ncbi:MAG: hypothetical protein ACK4M4_04720 [Flavobacterium sp.]
MKNKPQHCFLLLFFVAYSFVWITNQIVHIESALHHNQIEQIEKSMEEKSIDEQSKIGVLRIFTNCIVDLTIKTDFLKYDQLATFSNKKCFLKIVTPPPIG